MVIKIISQSKHLQGSIKLNIIISFYWQSCRIPQNATRTDDISYVTAIQILPVTTQSGKDNFLIDWITLAKDANNRRAIFLHHWHLWKNQTLLQLYHITIIQSWMRFQANITAHRLSTSAPSTTWQDHQDQLSSGWYPLRGFIKSDILSPCARNAGSTWSPATAAHTPNSAWAGKANL